MVRLSPGRWLNAQIHLLSWLGEDLHGETFLADLRPQQRTVFVRLMRSEACHTPEYLERFRRTAERAMALRHRHCAAVQAYGILGPPPEPPPPLRDPRQTPLVPRGSLPPPPLAAPPVPWIAMDPIEGADLRSLFIEGVSPGTLAALLLPVADVLDRAAALGLSHGEIVPASIVLVSDENDRSALRAVLLDLGLAKVLADNPLDVPLAPGALSYRSPEQCISGRQVEPAGDRYALATILYESLAGRPPFAQPAGEEVLRAQRSAPVPPLRALVPSLHRAQALDAFFVRALAKDPAARFPTATAMMEEFVLALGQPAGATERLQRRRRSLRWYRLRALQGEQMLDVVVGPRAVLGKQPECDVVCQGSPSPLHDRITSGISREHAVLIWLDDRLSVVDQSVNGTYVNGRAGSRLTAVPDQALLRLGEHLTLQVTLVRQKTSEGDEVAGALLERTDEYAAAVPATLMLWQGMRAAESPLAALPGPLSHGAVWVAQRELWWSGHPGVVWEREDGTPVMGAAPLRHGDKLVLDGQGVQIEH